MTPEDLGRAMGNLVIALVIIGAAVVLIGLGWWIFL